jgi:hypothetical protein
MIKVFKDAFSVGQRVWFARSHDKVTKLFGRILKIHSGSADCVDIATEPDGKAVEVAGIETAHAGDVVLAPAKPSASDLDAVAAEQAAADLTAAPGALNDPTAGVQG